jgi:hypothetical protein
MDAKVAVSIMIEMEPDASVFVTRYQPESEVGVDEDSAESR